MRIKTCEVFCQDKLNDMREVVKNLEMKTANFTTKKDLEKIKEQEKLTKQNFQMELDRFQQYLKDQNARTARQDSKQREIQNSINMLNEMGGLEQLAKTIAEASEVKEKEKQRVAPIVDSRQFMGSYEKQLRKMQEVMQQLGHRVDGLIDILDEKMDRNAIEALVCDKIGKEEI